MDGKESHGDEECTPERRGVKDHACGLPKRRRMGHTALFVMHAVVMHHIAAHTANGRDNHSESHKMEMDRMRMEKATRSNVHTKTATQDAVGLLREVQQHMQCQSNCDHTVGHIASERDHHWKPRTKGNDRRSTKKPMVLEDMCTRKRRSKGRRGC